MWLFALTSFDTYMADQRVPLGIAFELFGCVDIAWALGCTVEST